MVCFFAHSHGALGKARGNDHGQHLGCQAHGDADGKQASIKPIALGDAVNHKDKRNHHHHKADEHPRDAIDAFGKLVSTASSDRLDAIEPNKVCSPTLKASAVALPEITLLPMRAMFSNDVAESDSVHVAGTFSTGSLSPVRLARSQRGP